MSSQQNKSHSVFSFSIASASSSLMPARKRTSSTAQGSRWQLRGYHSSSSESVSSQSQPVAQNNRRSFNRSSTKISSQRLQIDAARALRTSSSSQSQTTLPSSGSRTQNTPHSRHATTSINRFDLDDDNAQNDEDDDDLNEIFMAVQIRDHGTIGCAYYVASTETLFFMDDVKSGGRDIIETLKLQINPTVVLVCSRAEDDMLECLTSSALDNDGDDTTSQCKGIDLPFILEMRPRGEFDYDSAISKLVQLSIGARNGPRVLFAVPGDLPGDNQSEATRNEIDFAPQAALMRLSAWIQMDSRVTVGCAGAILSYIQRRRLARFLPGDLAAREYFRLSTIELFSLRGLMYVNFDTMLSLQILQSESHPHQHRQGPSGSGSKESLSVYGVFAPMAKTPQGKELLKQYFLRPSLSQKVLCDRLDAISLFTRPDNCESLRSMVKSMRGIKNIRRLLIRLRGGVSGGTGKSGGIARNIWTGLREFSEHALNTFDILRNVVAVQDLSIFVQFEQICNTRDLVSVGSLIDQIVDFDESAIQRRTCVRPGVDHGLDERKRFYDGVGDLLSQVAQEITKHVPDDVPAELNVIYFPQIGFLIAMRLDSLSSGLAWEGNEDDHWERMFSIEDAVYYKNDQMKEMDERFGDLYSEICDREIELVHELAERILQHEELLANVSDLCGELDCLLAFSQAAEEYRLVRPNLNDDNNICIKSGRHILQELITPAFVPNDTLLAGREDDILPFEDIQTTNNDAANILVITGPNYSGKSVYMKQVALIVYLAHIGSFVPAESADIGLTDKILTRISTRESVSRNQSAFKIDLDQVCRALKLCTRRTLLIIDEFGKGTNCSDGAALACAAMEYLSGPGPEKPKTLIATHFHEIFENGYLDPQPGLIFLHMEVRIDEEASEAEDQVVYVYNLRQGRSGASYGTVCAAVNGIAMEIVERAEQLVLMHTRGEDLAVACAVMPDDELEGLEVAENIARVFLASDLGGSPRRLLEELLSG